MKEMYFATRSPRKHIRTRIHQGYPNTSESSKTIHYALCGNVEFTWNQRSFCVIVQPHQPTISNDKPATIVEYIVQNPELLSYTSSTYTQAQASVRQCQTHNTQWNINITSHSQHSIIHPSFGNSTRFLASTTQRKHSFRVYG